MVVVPSGEGAERLNSQAGGFSPVRWNDELDAVLAKEKMMRNETYQGILSLHSWGEADDILFLSSLSEPMAKELGWMSGKQVTVRYWVTDKPCTKDEAAEAAMMMVMGVADVDMISRYSEMTGYLWTDEDLNVGGHDLIAELKSSVGKWLILEVEAST